MAIEMIPAFMAAVPFLDGVMKENERLAEQPQR